MKIAHVRTMFTFDKAPTSYDIEVAVEEGEWVSRFDLSMIRHRRLIAELDALAEREDLSVVDNITLLDDKRHLLASWVHLQPEANRLLAGAFANQPGERAAP